MIETYAFFAVFMAQVLAMSVLYPAKFGRYVRSKAASLPVERLAQLFPDVDIDLAVERFSHRFRIANTAIAVLGLVLLGWLVSYMRDPSWDASVVIVLISVYFALQTLPLLVIAWAGFKFNKTHKRSLLEAKRKASLQRRGLFDFVSPLTILAAVLSYALLVSVVMWLQPTPMPGFALIGVLTLVYALQAFLVFRALYGKRSNPLEAQAIRAQTIGVKVRVPVYGCILCALFFACIFAVDVLDLQRWVPLAQSVCLLINTAFCLMCVTAPPHRPDGIVSAPTA